VDGLTDPVNQRGV